MLLLPFQSGWQAQTQRVQHGLAVSISSHTNHPCHYKCAILPLFVLDGILTHRTSTPRNFLIPPPIEKLFFPRGRWGGMHYKRHTLHTACFTHFSLLLSYESPTSPSPAIKILYGTLCMAVQHKLASSKLPFRLQTVPTRPPSGRGAGGGGGKAK